MRLYSLLYYCYCNVICDASCVVAVVKDASNEFRVGTSDLSQAQSEGLEFRVGAPGSERGLGSYEEPNVESVLHAYRVELWV